MGLMSFVSLLTSPPSRRVNSLLQVSVTLLQDRDEGNSFLSVSGPQGHRALTGP